MSLKVSIICLTVVLPQRQIQLSVHVPIFLYFLFQTIVHIMHIVHIINVWFSNPFQYPNDYLCLTVIVAHVRRRSCLLLPLWCTWWPLSLNQVCNELIDPTYDWIWLTFYLDIVILTEKKKGEIITNFIREREIERDREINSIKM